MLTMFLVGAFVGAALGYFLHALLGVAHDADLEMQCSACRKRIEGLLTSVA